MTKDREVLAECKCEGQLWATTQAALDREVILCSRCGSAFTPKYHAGKWTRACTPGWFRRTWEPVKHG